MMFKRREGSSDFGAMAPPAEPPMQAPASFTSQELQKSYKEMTIAYDKFQNNRLNETTKKDFVSAFSDYVSKVLQSDAEAKQEGISRIAAFTRAMYEETAAVMKGLEALNANTNPKQSSQSTIDYLQKMNEKFKEAIDRIGKDPDYTIGSIPQTVNMKIDSIDSRLDYIALAHFPKEVVVSTFGMNNRSIVRTGNMPNTDMGQRFDRIQKQMMVGGLQNESELDYLAAATSRADFYSRADKIYEYQNQRSQGFPRIKRTDENGKTVVDTKDIRFPDYIAYLNYIANKYSPAEARVFTFGFTDADSAIGKTLAERLNKFKYIVDRMSSKYGVDKNLIYAVIAQESGGNPNAESWCGAKGLMQLMDATASDMNVKDSKNPEQNIEGGTKYLKQLLNQFGGDARLALIGYNAGPKRVERYMQNGWLPDETRDYVPRVMSFYQQFQEGKLAVQADRKSLVDKGGT